MVLMTDEMHEDGHGLCEEDGHGSCEEDGQGSREEDGQGSCERLQSWVVVRRILSCLGNESREANVHECMFVPGIKLLGCYAMLPKNTVRKAEFCGNDFDLEVRLMQLKSWSGQLLISQSLANHQMASGHSFLVSRERNNYMHIML